MIEHPLSLLRAELAAVDSVASFWKRVALANALLAAVCFGIAVTALVVSIGIGEELLAYRSQCMKATTADQIVKLTAVLVKINDQCFELHQRNVESFETHFPGFFETDEGKSLRYVYEVEDEREAVSQVRRDEALDGLLQGEGS